MNEPVPDNRNQLAVVVPTRGRPENAERLLRRWEEVTHSAQLVFAIDEDDPKMMEYLQIPVERPIVSFMISERSDTRMAGALNKNALPLAEMYFAVGFMGDDHLPQTKDWDAAILITLLGANPGIAYANDLLQGANLPTQVFMTSDVIRTLGYMVPPKFVHMYLDNVWKEWGVAINALSYLPNVIIEHLHPVAGKADGDVGYAEADSFMGPDKLRFESYMSGVFYSDRAKLRTLLANSLETKDPIR